MRTAKRARGAAGFTLIELMIAIGIILVLITIAVPVYSRVRRAAPETNTKAQISALDTAIQRYQQDYGAYPGPLLRAKLYSVATANNQSGLLDYANGNAVITNVTGAENLALGLLGGLRPQTGTPPPIEFDKSLLGRGPRSLNTLNPKGATVTYIEGMSLSEGHYKDGAGEADDSVIPEIVDRFPNAMPILYLRAQTGASGVVSIEGKDNNVDMTMQTQYDLREALPYTKGKSGSIGEGKSIRRDAYKLVTVSGTDLPHGLQTVNSNRTFDKGDGANYTYPYDAFPYFQNRAFPPTDITTPQKKNQTGTPRNKDKYILISAGVDRVYGTDDDITNFGNSITE
jgi:prepilin-type N-terminal cleavage/methylation domain-containing protein